MHLVLLSWIKIKSLNLLEILTGSVGEKLYIGRMSTLLEIVDDLDLFLNVSQVKDYPGAKNGLQVENSGEVKRVVAAVDASEAVLRSCGEESGTLLLVHHGLYWQDMVPVTGYRYRKMKWMLERDMAVYSAHLPLDIHREVGNNVLLAQAIGLREVKEFFGKSGDVLGLIGEWSQNGDALCERVEAAVGGAVHRCGKRSEEPRRVAVITGGAGSEVEWVAAQGVDVFVTGEAPHWAAPLAEELGVELLLGGHYATEVFGVKALAERVSQKFSLPWEFKDFPTGL